MQAAQRVAYDETGSPAFGGQAIVITSCAGQGWSCHSSRALRRYATPAGTDFDVLIATAPGDEAVLQRARLNVHRLRESIYAQAVSGEMPPLEIGARVLAEQAVYRYDDVMGDPVPGVRTAEGRETLRNWLACGSPVVERTTDPASEPCTSDADCLLTACDPHPADPRLRECLRVGYVEARGATAITPTWASLYDGVIAHGCAIVSCHDGIDAAGQLDLSSAAVAYGSLVAHADTGGCGTRVIAGDPDTSVLVLTLEGTSCTPVGTFHTSAFTGAIREWIAAGAAE
jgi:hypothetical protein